MYEIKFCENIQNINAFEIFYKHKFIRNIQFIYITEIRKINIREEVPLITLFLQYFLIEDKEFCSDFGFPYNLKVMKTNIYGIN